MKDEFICQQCGNCCRWMGFDHITVEDRERWIKEGRDDILKYVGNKCKDEEGNDAYTFTAYPIIENIRDAYKRRPCVFLTKDKRKYKCCINDTKPTICKTFPTSMDVAHYCNGLRKMFGEKPVDANELIKILCRL